MPFQKGNQLGKKNKGIKRKQETIEKQRKITLERYAKGEKFGFQKDHSFYPGGEKGWFKKDQKPWNKNMKGFMEGDKNNQWKGNKAGYSALHGWVKRKMGTADRCVFDSCHAGKFEWANVSREYKRDLNDWISLCAKCHDNFDRKDNWGVATKKFKELRKKEKC